MPRVKYAMNYGPKNSFSMSYASRKVIFPGVDRNVVNCQLNALKCDSAKLSITYRSCASVDQNFDTPQSIWMQLSIHINCTLAANNDCMIIYTK